ncbi:RNA polymerase sigma factor [Streptomyces sp. NBC_00448]|uniref:RNA polymerase sigma factor n=1 Tax=Streptomyces sp. NBC_00448 TaxID=2903652 RepID=UPI002E1AAAAF
MTSEHDERGDRDGDAQLSRAADDPAAFTPLVEKYSAALHGYFARRMPGAADDLLSEAWLQAFAARRTFDASRGTARGWLFGVARNVLAGHVRRAARAEAPAQVEVTDPWQAVDQRLDAAALAPALRSALAELPSEEREVMLLVCWEQLTPAEAATAMGIPFGTARSRLYRARGRLRERIAPDRPAGNRPAGQSLAATGDLA